MDLKTELTHLDELSTRPGDAPDHVRKNILKRQHAVYQKIADGATSGDKLLDLAILLNVDRAQKIHIYLNNLRIRLMGKTGQFLIYTSMAEKSDICMCPGIAPPDQRSRRSNELVRVDRLCVLTDDALIVDLRTTTWGFATQCVALDDGTTTGLTPMDPGPLLFDLHASMTILGGEMQLSRAYRRLDDEMHSFIVGDEEVLAWLGSHGVIAENRFKALLRLDAALGGRITKGGTPFDGRFRDLAANTLEELIGLKRSREHCLKKLEHPPLASSVYSEGPATLVGNLREARRKLDALIGSLGPLGLRHHPHILDFLAHKDDPFWG